MVKLYASLLSLTLTTSLALAAPYPRDLLLERDLDEEFSGREYLSNEFDDLAAREPSFFGSIEHAVKDVGKVANKGLHVAENIASNPLVQTAASFIPGEAQVAAAGKVIGAIGKVERFEKLAKKANQARRKVDKLEHLEGGLKKGKKIDKAIRKEIKADRKVNKARKHLGGAEGKVKKFDKAIKRAKQVHKIASGAHTSAHHTSERRHHRRDLEDNEELSRRDLDAEELFEREYDDDILAERDFFDDLD